MLVGVGIGAFYWPHWIANQPRIDGPRVRASLDDSAMTNKDVAGSYLNESMTLELSVSNRVVLSATDSAEVKYGFWSMPVELEEELGLPNLILVEIPAEEDWAELVFELRPDRLIELINQNQWIKQLRL